jgi:hypothetical protein
LTFDTGAVEGWQIPKEQEVHFMSILRFSIFSSLLVVSLAAADNAKQTVTSAAKKLGDNPNYSWTTTVTVPESSQFRPGPTEGKTDKTVGTHLTFSFGDNTFTAVLKGDKGASSNQDGEWRSIREMEESEGPGRFMARLLQNFKAPAEQAAELAAASKELKQDGETYSSELTEEGAKNLMSFGRRGGGDAPQARNAKGSVKFWVKDGVLSKYEFKVKGTREFNGNDVEIDRTTMVEIKNVGSTKVTIPESAKAKLS